LEEGTPAKYKVIITRSAETFFYEVVEYIYEHHSLSKAEYLSTSLKEAPRKLTTYPSRGAIEPRLAKYRERIYRYILFKRTYRADIKIIYYINEQTKEVYVTDFFPTEKDDSKISERNY